MITEKRRRLIASLSFPFFLFLASDERRMHDIASRGIDQLGQYKWGNSREDNGAEAVRRLLSTAQPQEPAE